MSPAERDIERTELPEWVQPARERRRKDAAEEHAEQERQAPLASADQLAPAQIGKLERQRANVLEAARDAEAVIGEEEEKECDAADRCTSNRPMDRGLSR